MIVMTIPHRITLQRISWMLFAERLYNFRTVPYVAGPSYAYAILYLHTANLHSFLVLVQYAQSKSPVIHLCKLKRFSANFLFNSFIDSVAYILDICAPVVSSSTIHVKKHPVKCSAGRLYFL